MANQKISALPASTTPLAGSEVLPIVQAGTTDQVSVDNLTAGRAVSGASFNVTGSVAPTNGVYLPTANSVGVATNGTIKTTVDASGNLRINVNNLIIGTAGKGIDFSANAHAAGMTNEVLNWYEDGTYTPTVTSGTGAITSYTATALYTRIGRQVTVNANVTITDAGTGGGVCTITLPFPNNGSVVGNAFGRENAVTGSQLQGSIALNASTTDVRQFNNATIVATGVQIRVTATYFV